MVLAGMLVAAGLAAPSPAAAAIRLGPITLTPETILDGVPPDVTPSPKSIISFHSSGAATGSECSLDGAVFRACTSPLTLVTGAGRHRLAIRAVGPTGPDPTPATTGWRVAVSAPAGYGPWADTAGPIVATTTTTIEDQLQHVTLMNVTGKVTPLVPGRPWYLWTWTHDTPRMRLFTAAKATGPFVEAPVPVDPAGPPLGFCSCHWSSGDIVWDRETKRFYSTPHSVEASSSTTDDVGYFGRQNTFITTSLDGVTWTRLGDDHPIIPNGDAGAFDDYEIAYGRFLRDIDGNLVRVNGQAIWYYRGTNRPLTCDATTQDCTGLDAPENRQFHSLGAATSTDLVHWTKVSKTPIAILFGENGIFDVGSAIYSGGQTTLTTAINDTMFQRGSADPLKWSDAPLAVDRISLDALGPLPVALPLGVGKQTVDPGIPIYQHPSVLYDGGSLVRDGDALRMAFGNFAVSRYEVRLISTLPLGTGRTYGT